MAAMGLHDLKTSNNLTKFSNLTLKCDFLTLNMTSGAVENDTIKLAVLKSPYINTKIVFYPF